MSRRSRLACKSFKTCILLREHFSGVIETLASEALLITESAAFLNKTQVLHTQGGFQSSLTCSTRAQISSSSILWLIRKLNLTEVTQYRDVSRPEHPLVFACQVPADAL